MHLSTLITLVTISCLSLLSGQEVKPKCTCRMVFLERTSGSPNQAFIFDGTTNHSVKLSSMNLSDPVTLSEGTIFISMTSKKITDLTTLPATAPRVKIPLGSTQLYIIVANDINNKVFPVRLLAIDSSDNKLKQGQTLWINLSNNIVAGRLNQKKFTIAAKKKLITSPPLDKAGYYKTAFAYKPVDKDKYHPIMQKTWWHDPESKYLGFIINRGGRLPKIFTFRDRLRKNDEEEIDPPENPSDN